ncbi:tRNA (adenosine(37)-N6)-threonylcarbamoyltransferase complex dimerization subunit type 1 TsaB [Pararoseomonas indoligenes]|uniref:tRNA (Adenosine(37)-N6)-threonylcarbamoyltransferase complex dimerization subunit type 1 TsaB n=1 Tax=Roseomonas indoligenes TaxID=2820811 RepID=A0A940N437_9PROT|nr:tRNA (adenosine(37)-N6)-threonylcarbamoyltransferase complex dimerization subunit type 1 TsaB [Pararoseomonas indoligenes]MBP0496425.1 tRNA (adenosine(37)-N6)-threonylcarbamoyltransferase complex dimerization subunit type 1 TsaB [Pararoseomonas indoligenes]
MQLLALDAALACASVALWQDGAVLAEASREGSRGQPAALPALADAVLRQAGNPRPGAVAVSVGPGGFTGLRAAIALGRGLADGWGVPLLGVTTGEALAAALDTPQAAGRTPWSVTLAGRGGLVLERLGEAPALLDEAALPTPEGPVVLMGDAAPQAAARLLARGANALLSGARLPHARFVAAAAARRMAEGAPPRPAAPLYAEPLALRVPGPAA